MNDKKSNFWDFARENPALVVMTVISLTYLLVVFISAVLGVNID